VLNTTTFDNSTRSVRFFLEVLSKYLNTSCPWECRIHIIPSFDSGIRRLDRLQIPHRRLVFVEISSCVSDIFFYCQNRACSFMPSAVWILCKYRLLCVQNIHKISTHRIPLQQYLDMITGFKKKQRKQRKK